MSDYLLHPLSNYLISIPLRVIETICSMLGLVDDPANFKMKMAIYVSPFFTALKVVCFYISFRLLNLNTLHSTIAAAIAALSFSTFVFGAVPCSYPVSSFAFSVTILCSISLVKYSNRISGIGYYIGSIVAVGLTVSNIMVVGWIRRFVYSANGDKHASSLYKAILNSAAILAVAIIAFFALNQVFASVRGEEPSNSEIAYTSDFLDKYIPTAEIQIEKAARFPEMVTRTILPTMPVQNPDINMYTFEGPIKNGLSYIKAEFDIYSALYTLVALVSIGGGGIICYRKGPIWKVLTLSSVAMLITLWLFYSWLGHTFYLYSQTWYVPCILLLSGWLTKPFFNKKLDISLLVSLLKLMLIGDIYVVSEVTKWFVIS